MSNVVKYSINGDTNADQVTDKVKKSISNLEKNIEGINNKFKSFGKDLFLSFAAPMVLVTSALSLISKMIEENQRKQEEATRAAIDGTNELISAEDRYWANKRDKQKKSAESKEQAALAREQITKDFLLNTPQGAALMQIKGAGEDPTMPGWLKALKRISGGREGDAGRLAKSPEVQMAVQSNLFEMQQNDPEVIAKKKAEEAAAKQKEAAEAQIAAQKEVDKMPTTFKGPDGGFSNVVGVGANPVIEAMAAQLDEAKKTNDLLAQLVTSGGGRTSSWLNAPSGGNTATSGNPIKNTK
jgi:type IV secretory pathway VirB4 component